MIHKDDSIEVRYGWVVLAASLAIHSIGLGAPTILFVTLKPIAADLGTARAVPSMAYSLLMIGTGIGGLFMGWWMDKKGIVQPVMFGAVMLAAGALLASQTSGKWDLYIANGLLIGLMGKAAMIAPLVANATRWFDRRRGLAIAIIASGQGLAGAVWPPIVHHLNATVGWRETYFYFAILMLVVGLPMIWFLRPKPPAPKSQAIHHSATEDGRVLGLPANVVQLMLWVATIGCCAGMAIPILHLFSHATDLGHDPVSAAKLLTVLFIAGFISRIVFGMVADRIGPTATLLIGSTCQTIMLAVFAVVDSLTGLYVAALLFGLGFSGIMPCYPLMVRLYFPVSQSGSRIASLYMFAALGMALGGWMGGAIYDATGSYMNAFLAAVAFTVMNLIVVAMLHMRQRRPQAVGASA